MKLTKKVETEVTKVYNTWLQSYLNGDVKTYDSYLDDEYRFIGSTNNEEFLNKRDTTKFLAKTADQLAGKTDLRNTVRTIDSIDGIVFFTELFDAFFLIESEWTYYGRFRFTSALRKKKESWRFIYQHFSMPDSKASEGETLGAEQISKENQQLKDAIKRRTVELEQKNKELEIESSLERVRTQAMTMTKSSDLLDIVVTMRSEFTKLGHEAHYFWHMAWLPSTYQKAMTSGDGSRIGNVMELPRNFHQNKAMMTWEKSVEPVAVFTLETESAVDYVEKMVTLGDFQNIDPNAPTLDDVRHIGGLTFIMARTTHGEIGYSLPGVVKNPPNEDLNILVRFASVFDLAHKRFLDIEKAEKQVREAQIEAALERVRSKTMAMHNSKDVGDTVVTLFYEVLNLGLDKSIRCGIGILEGFDGMQTWSATLDSKGEVDLKMGMLNMTIHPLLKGVKSWWKKGKSGFKYELIDKDVFKYYKALNDDPGYPFDANLETLPGKVFHNSFVFAEGILFSFTSNPLSEEAVRVLNRFTAVFEQTYTRFLDLQKAEAQAKEAKVEAGLERVRSRTLAMHKSDELVETSVVVFKQLMHLGIEPSRLFIGIIKDKSDDIEAWATNEAGTKIDNHFILHSKKNISIKKMYEGWKKKKKSITIDLYGKELNNYFQYLTKELKINFKDGLSQKRRVQTIAYFSQGFIGMASSDEQPLETTILLERFAAVFNLTYTRFHDLKIAEAYDLKAKEDLIKLQTEKKRAESALTELKATQSQLIQSEKMASLGELTAGIAHEIQNPLNFVNNFSELSEELLEELQDEIKENPDDIVKEILTDLKQNLNKITNHGKRASNIVKGMLDHSRTSSGIKELTDINILADEYLRLSYHGLRAKDKSFNAEFKMDLDQSLPKVEVLAQDFGRVILNLINNAFYAVNQKSKESGEDYKPTVNLITKKKKNAIEITVKDNGSGISKDNCEKIFQPFFTTKPTGEGTGLGLSLAYDIITKGHGGELKVESIEGEGLPADQRGSEFIIVLPIKK